jgi:hypothetical protein
LDAFLSTEMLSALSNGDLKKAGVYFAIFFFIWLEVRGMKKELSNINKTIGHRFDEGEKRFDNIEDRLKNLENVVQP